MVFTVSRGVHLPPHTLYQRGSENVHAAGGSEGSDKRGEKHHEFGRAAHRGRQRNLGEEQAHREPDAAEHTDDPEVLLVHVVR